MYITAILTPEEKTVQQAASAANTTTETTPDFSDCMKEAQSGTSLSSIFEKASETYGVSVSLLTAMAKQESNFQADATSKSGAMGIMQLMPQTAEYLGCSEPYNPEQNIMAGARYISELLDKYDGNVSLALAAYNAGSGNVAKYGGIPPFEETQNYVAKVTAYMEQGVSLPDGTNISGNNKVSSLAQSVIDKLDSDDFKDILGQLFSYEDYLNFINLLIKELTATDATTNTVTKETSSAASDQSATAGNTTDTRTKTDSTTTDITSGMKTFDVKVTSTPDSYYAYQSINYNNSVLNLMSQTPT